MGRQRKKRGNPISGWLIVDKPQGLTSTQVIGRVRRALSPQKIGHAGTLDPMATGILPIAMGEATKTVPFGMDADKDYRFRVQFGTATDSLDAEGEVTETGLPFPESVEAISAVLAGFLGDIDQMPPAFSALKIDGKRAYDLARAGETVELKSRRVQIYALTLLAYDPEGGFADFDVTCGKGTYVRSLGRDIALKLGTVGHLTMLRRLRVGAFGLKQSISLENLDASAMDAPADSGVLPLETVLDDIPAHAVGADEARRIRMGQAIAVAGAGLVSAPLPEATAQDEPSGTVPPAPALTLLMHEGKALALAERSADAFKPVRVFNQPSKGES